MSVWTIHSLAGVLVLGTVVAPVQAQEVDVLGVLREDGVAVLWYSRTPAGWTFPSRENASSEYIAHVLGGGGQALRAEPPMDLLDDYDPVWGQTTSYEPVSEDCRCYPIPRVGYLVTDSVGEAPFRALDRRDPSSVQAAMLADSIAASAGYVTPVTDELLTWVVDLEGDRLAFFDFNRSSSSGACLAVSGWFRPGDPPSNLHINQANPHDCEYKGAGRFRPWVLLRRAGSLLLFLEQTGYEGLDPELWRYETDGWQRVARVR